MKILVVEDEAELAALVRKILEAEGFAVDTCTTGEEALQQIRSVAYNVVILDIMLPGRDGLSVLRQLQTEGAHPPVLLYSARGAVNERVEGLNLGADDYLPKPFAVAELIARVRVLGRRSSHNPSSILRIGDLTLDPVSRQAQRAGKTFELTAREFRLLEYLMRSPGQICKRTAILEKVWDHDFSHNTNVVEVYIRRLREKIDEGFEPKLLQTIRGVGYGLKEPS
jgi:DNA-binding response OmpR family regulator